MSVHYTAACPASGGRSVWARLTAAEGSDGPEFQFLITYRRPTACSSRGQLLPPPPVPPPLQAHSPAPQAPAKATPCGCQPVSCPTICLYVSAATLLVAAAELQDACGLPLGLVVQPLAQPEGAPPPTPACWASDLARCARCQAYINSLCEVEADGSGWACSLCGCANDFSTATSLRR